MKPEDVKCQADYDRYIAYEKTRLNRDNGVIDNIHELKGWTLCSLERYKPGVIRFTAKRDVWNDLTGDARIEIRTGFGKDEVFDGLIVVEPQSKRSGWDDWSVDNLANEMQQRMKYFYGKTDGTIEFPNSVEGDLLKLMHSILKKVDFT